jgi:hypothetical protein
MLDESYHPAEIFRRDRFALEIHSPGNTAHFCNPDSQTNNELN